MEPKNIIAAISLSAAVIILYGLFFAPPPPEPKIIPSDKNIVNETTDAPSLEQNEQISKILYLLYFCIRYISSYNCSYR